MRYSTSTKITLVLFTLGAMVLAIYFYLDVHDKNTQFFVYSLTPLMILLWFPALVIIWARLMAMNRKEENIPIEYFKKSAKLAVVLLFMKWLIDYVTNL